MFCIGLKYNSIQITLNSEMGSREPAALKLHSSILVWVVFIRW